MQELAHLHTHSPQVTSTVEFTRIWWDKHAKHPSLSQVSFWRPVPPPGYVALGDCMVTGMYCPPNNVLVLRDTDPATQAPGVAPLLARPLKCLQVRFCCRLARACNRTYAGVGAIAARPRRCYTQGWATAVNLECIVACCVQHSFPYAPLLSA